MSSGSASFMPPKKSAASSTAPPTSWNEAPGRTYSTSELSMGVSPPRGGSGASERRRGAPPREKQTPRKPARQGREGHLRPRPGSPRGGQRPPRNPGAPGGAPREPQTSVDRSPCGGVPPASRLTACRGSPLPGCCAERGAASATAIPEQEGNEP